MTKKLSKEQLPRKTIKNFVSLLFSGQFVEIFKVLRRRLINALKFLRRILLFFWWKVYDYPPLLKRRQQRQLVQLLRKYYYYSGDPKSNASTVGLILREGSTHPKSSAFIRLIGPLTDQSINNKVQIKLLPDNSTAASEESDIIIVQRTAFDNLGSAREFVNNLRANSKRLVVDADDAFHSIDRSHPEHSEHKGRIDALNYLLEEADQVWLSTRRLEPYMPKLRSKPVIIENSLDPRIWKHDVKTKSSSNRPLELVYMGTGTHSADLAMILPALDHVAKTQPDSFRLTVIGVASQLPEREWLRRKHVRRSRTVYPKFVEWFLRQGPFDLGLCPLVDSAFNKSKTDIKCLDYMGAAVVPIVSDIEPYQAKELDDLVIRVKNSVQDWEETLSSLVKNPGETREQNQTYLKRGYEYLWQKRSSELTAKKLLELLEKL